MKVKKDLSWALAEEICDDLNEYLRDHDVWDLAFIGECDATWLVLATDSFDGDWKHDHLRWDHLAEKFFKERYNIDEIDVRHEYTDDTGCDWGQAYHRIALPVRHWALVNSEDAIPAPAFTLVESAKKSRVRKNDDGVRIVDELNSLMDLASYFDEIRVKYGLPDNGMAWNDEAMLYEFIYDVRKTLERLVDQINDMRENGGKRL